ncbi:MAG: hypothetical protein K2H85_06630 [Allobaculum sp.]|nr:hypothetical protein [Allobaculum sp.]
MTRSLLKICMVSWLNQKIAQKEGFSFDTVYVDETKLEAYANRYTFVYRKRTIMEKEEHPN